jgi:hypothetical protein
MLTTARHLQVLLLLASSAPIGSRVEDTVLDVARSGRRLLVVAFVSADCPVAELYAGRLATLSEEYVPRGVGFLALAPNERDNCDALSRFSIAHHLRFPVYRDLGAKLAGRLGVVRTPTVVLLDDRGAIRYRGRIDDQYAVGSRRAGPSRDDLAAAIEDVLAGRPVAVPETEAAGCPIERPVAIPNSDVTYCRDIAPILERRCATCHRNGQAGPFPLTTYAEAEGWADAIGEVVASGRMPPWHADPRYGRFSNDSRLTPQEKQAIERWVGDGAPEGDQAHLPAPASHAEGWSIKPDLVVDMPEAYHVRASGVIDYQYFEVDPGFREDRWVRSAEIRPGNRKVVHHCTVFLKAPGSLADIDEQGDLGSYCLVPYVPGISPMVLPDGMAKRVPAGWKLVFVVHYTPIGVAQEDRTSVGLVFADPRSVRREVATQLMVDPGLGIPPHAADYRVEHSRSFSEDTLLLSMFPHMHLRGKSFRYEVTYPDGQTEILLDVPRYDFNWQTSYVLTEPKRLPAGTVLRCIAHYDNSRSNPVNPDPGATVRTGRQSWDEMFNGYYDIALADQDLTKASPTMVIGIGLVAALACARLIRRRLAQ